MRACVWVYLAVFWGIFECACLPASLPAFLPASPAGTPDLSPTYAMMTRRDGYTMEHWLAFVETFSAYVFRPGVLGPAGGVLERLWGLLVKIVEHYCRHTPTVVTKLVGGVPVAFLVQKGTEESAAIGAGYGHEFASFMEEMGFPDNQFTSNLHLICCRCILGGHVSRARITTWVMESICPKPCYVYPAT